MTARNVRYVQACIEALLCWTTEDLNKLVSVITAELQNRILESRAADAEWMPGSE
jgi:hypothetical protein